jgi:hypothetical protein
MMKAKVESNAHNGNSLKETFTLLDVDPSHDYTEQKLQKIKIFTPQLSMETP